jgi:hypothetical protein
MFIKLHKSLLLSLFAMALSLMASNGYALVVKANLVPNLTTTNVFTVPAGTAVMVKSVLLANDNAASASSQRLFRSGLDVTAFMTAPARNSFQANFDPGIRYTAGQIVQVRNGASSGPISFTVVLEFVDP